MLVEHVADVELTLQSDQVGELKVLRDENARLKKLVAEFSLDKAILRDVAAKKPARPALTRRAVEYIVAHGHARVRYGRRIQESGFRVGTTGEWNPLSRADVVDVFSRGALAIEVGRASEASTFWPRSVKRPAT